VKARAYFATVGTLALLFLGCGSQALVPQTTGPTPLKETTTQTTDQVIVNFQVNPVQQFQSTDFRFQGSVQNLGPPLQNARFVVIARQNNLNPAGFQEQEIIATQNFGLLLQGQTQVITVHGVVPNVLDVTVFGQFTHD
jgi:hypothetical protein